jgi:FkbM family methyltransferase
MFFRIRACLRELVRKRGFDVVRFYPVAKMLNQRNVDLVFDVGANTGQYASSLRRHGYRGRIVSFEPFMKSFNQLEENAAKDELWTAVHLALGDRHESKTINICSADSKFSSFLKARRGADAFAKNSNTSTELTSVATLDSVIDDYAHIGDRIFLKSDTQGYERQVLAGAEHSLERLLGLQLEMSIFPLYEDQPALDEMIGSLRKRGFRLWFLQRGLADFKIGKTFEVDGIFFREE